MTRLGDALRKKYKNPQAVADCLGIPIEVFVDRLAMDARRKSSARDEGPSRREGSKVWSQNDDVERAQAESEVGRDEPAALSSGDIERCIRMLYEHGVDSDTRRKVSYFLHDLAGAADEDPAERIAERSERTDEGTASPASMQWSLDNFKQALRDRGLAEDDIERACDMLPFPRNGLPSPGAMRKGGGQGGRLSEHRMAGDAAVVKRLARRFPGFERIVPGADSAPRHIKQRPASAEEQASFARRFPDAARIVIGG